MQMADFNVKQLTLTLYDTFSQFLVTVGIFALKVFSSVPDLRQCASFPYIGHQALFRLRDLVLQKRLNT